VTIDYESTSDHASQPGDQFRPGNVLPRRAALVWHDHGLGICEPKNPLRKDAPQQNTYRMVGQLDTLGTSPINQNLFSRPSLAAICIKTGLTVILE